MNTVDELRDCLHKVRRERQDLFDELSYVQQREDSSRVRKILNHYQEKGSRDEFERERNLRSSSTFSDTDDSPVRRSSRRDRELSSSSYSPHRQVTPRQSSSQTRYLAYDDLSPTSNREIYPHRKSYQARSRSVSPKTRRYTSPGPYSSVSNLDDSLVDQTLQDIEQEMAKERQTILSSSRSTGSSDFISKTRARLRSRSKSPVFKYKFELDDDSWRKRRSASSSPHRLSPRQGILKTREAARSRSPSPSVSRFHRLR